MQEIEIAAWKSLTTCEAFWSFAIWPFGVDPAMGYSSKFGFQLFVA